MAQASPEFWQIVFLAGAALLVLVQAWRGWRLGIVRQIAEIIAIVGGYAAAWFLGPSFAPLFRPLGMPDQVLTAVAGFTVGIVFYAVVTIFSGVLFKRTSHQSVGVVRLGFGVSGAVVGAAFGLVIVWGIAVGLRLCGTLAEAKVKSSHQAAATGRAMRHPTAEPAAEEPEWIRSLAQLKEALDTGATGAVMKQMDPLPGGVYAVLGKLGTVFSDAQTVERFLSFPGVKPIAEHPKIIALRDDPQIVHDMASSNILGLMRNPHLVAAANDPEVVSLVKRVDFQKALDYAMGNSEKPLRR